MTAFACQRCKGHALVLSGGTGYDDIADCPDCNGGEADLSPALSERDTGPGLSPEIGFVATPGAHVCATCRGAQQLYQEGTLQGVPASWHDCPDCDGKGEWWPAGLASPGSANPNEQQ